MRPYLSSYLLDTANKEATQVKRCLLWRLNDQLSRFFTQLKTVCANVRISWGCACAGARFWLSLARHIDTHRHLLAADTGLCLSVELHVQQCSPSQFLLSLKQWWRSQESLWISGSPRHLLMSATLLHLPHGLRRRTELCGHPTPFYLLQDWPDIR